MSLFLGEIEKSIEQEPDCKTCGDTGWDYSGDPPHAPCGDCDTLNPLPACNACGDSGLQDLSTGGHDLAPCSCDAGKAHQ